MSRTATTDESQDPRSADLVLEAAGLSVGYGGRPVLGGVDLQVHRGEFWFLVGPNGQGKTTLLLAMLGRLRPLAGRVAFHGEAARPERRGFVPQHSSLNPTLPTTVREFVRLGLVGTRTARAQRQQQLAWALQQVDLVGMEDRDFWSLSGGQRQRALVARALIRRPQFLIADEPTSGLDLSVATALYESLAALNRTERLTVILVTHDLAVAARYGTHLAVVHHGGVDAGPVEAILRSGRLEQAYEVPITVAHETSGLVSIQLAPGTARGQGR
jgi:ABC-type Mn2+/Zn2+ transport system ATPase subunit